MFTCDISNAIDISYRVIVWKLQYVSKNLDNLRKKPKQTRLPHHPTNMDMAKSFFGSRDHVGYVGKDEHSVSVKYISFFLPMQIFR